MAVDGWFGNKSKFQGNSAAQSAAAVPDGVAVKCLKCSEILFAREFEKNLKVCSKCGHHHRISAQERIDYTVDAGSFDEFSTEIYSDDPLNFPQYQDKLEQAWRKIGRGDAFRVGRARIGGHACVLGVSEFAFRGGSMGSVTGEKITRALEVGIEEGLPVVFVTSSGGARMEEGLISLMQMAKTSATVAHLGIAGLPLIVVMCDPTIGGVPASYASLGDVILAEPGAIIGLAGQRVAAQAQTGKLPQNYQTSEWRQEHGQVDAVVARKDLPDALSRLISLLNPSSVAFTPAPEILSHPVPAGDI